MVTGKDEFHEPLARVAVQCFIDQSYENTELLVVNDGPYAVDVSVDPRIRQVRPMGKLSLGELRNFGRANARGDWIIQWDDDDFHHPHRILYQMAHRREDHAVVLSHQIRINLLKSQAFNITDEFGIAGTILHPNKELRDYPDEAKNEDTMFVHQNFIQPQKLVKIDNRSDIWPGPALYTRLYHGHNTWDEQHVMGGDDSFTGRYDLNRDEVAYVQEILKNYGVRANVTWRD
jgi:glycosyltransferase involved in cell wall biosynthesis